MVVLVFAYSGVLTSLLTVPKLEPIVNTVEELIESGKLRITIERNIQISREFLVVAISKLSLCHVRHNFFKIRMRHLDLNKLLATNCVKIQNYW